MVALSFAASTFWILIHSSFADWAESSVASAVTTHSVADLQFPNFTIWHPKGLNGALKYDLMKLAKKNLSSEKQEVALLFNKEGGESISGLTSENDTDYLCRGHHKVILDSSQILVKMSNPTGSFESLFCGGHLKKHLCRQVVHQHHSQNQQNWNFLTPFQYQNEKNRQRVKAEGFSYVKKQLQMFILDKFHLFSKDLTWEDAALSFLRRGGRLPSIL